MGDVGPEPLDAAGVAAFLHRHGVVADGVPVDVKPLTGGVSADVFAATTRESAWVVKQPLSRLRVEQDWTADPGRVVTEARALEIAERVMPHMAPQLVLLDQSRCALVETLAPAHLTEWRAQLLELDGGAVATAAALDSAAALGTALARLHRGTVERPDVLADFGDLESFIELRIEPFHLAVATAVPQAGATLERLAQELLARPMCLVHGDFSPKNVLADGPDVWVLDWEVAHAGNPVFDVAMMLAHLVCKAVHRPERAKEYVACGRAFVERYRTEVGTVLDLGDRSIVEHTAGVVLSRTDGKSPVLYFSPVQVDRARRLALTWLSSSSAQLPDVWSDVS